MSRAPAHDGFSFGCRYGPAVIDVESDDADAGRWLTEFLTPWFEVCEPGQGSVSVRLTCSSRAFAAIERRQAAATTRQVACFALDSQIVNLPGWTEGPDTVIAHAGLRCYYRVQGRSVEIIARPGERLVRLGLMRVVREIATARVVGQGGVLDLHAAALVAEGRAVLLVGPRWAGKTTLLVSVLASGRAGLLANDRVFVHTGSAPEQASGVPTLVTLRSGTLELFPELRPSFPTRPALLHTAELKSEHAATLESGNPRREFALSSSQLAEGLGISIVHGAPVGAIVFPEVDHSVDPWSLEPITPPEGTARLRECFYGIGAGPGSHTILERVGSLPDERHEREDQAAFADRLSARFPLFRCRFGPNACRHSADRWLDALGLKPAREDAPRE